jgi:DNA-directed RNA polymerase specialized sigma24 family protein
LSRLAEQLPEIEPTQQTLLEQRYIHESPLKEIGDDTGTTPSAVHQRLKTAHHAVVRRLAA